eukprot:c6929_g1_i1.p1 GENE.c6929_g1_i1~~c6929_g1_i1.p1  ORF type:complete len:1073 (+),score=233.02 c6929_g1_i1:439-3219(+)
MEELFHPDRYKTEWCDGKCERGDFCSFKHPNDNFDPPWRNQPYPVMTYEQYKSRMLYYKVVAPGSEPCANDCEATNANHAPHYFSCDKYHRGLQDARRPIAVTENFTWSISQRPGISRMEEWMHPDCFKTIKCARNRMRDGYCTHSKSCLYCHGRDEYDTISEYTLRLKIELFHQVCPNGDPTPFIDANNTRNDYITDANDVSSDSMSDSEHSPVEIENGLAHIGSNGHSQVRSSTPTSMANGNGNYASLLPPSLVSTSLLNNNMVSDVMHLESSHTTSAIGMGWNPMNSHQLQGHSLMMSNVDLLSDNLHDALSTRMGSPLPFPSISSHLSATAPSSPFHSIDPFNSTFNSILAYQPQIGTTPPRSFLSPSPTSSTSSQTPPAFPAYPNSFLPDPIISNFDVTSSPNETEGYVKLPCESDVWININNRLGLGSYHTCVFSGIQVLPSGSREVAVKLTPLGYEYDRQIRRNTYFENQTLLRFKVSKYVINVQETKTVDKIEGLEVPEWKDLSVQGFTCIVMEKFGESLSNELALCQTRAPNTKFPLLYQTFGNNLHVTDLSIRIVREFLMGLRDLHNNNHIHRDIRPANLLVNLDEVTADAPVIKVCDFGLARELDAASLGQHTTTTAPHLAILPFQPPEVHPPPQQAQHMSWSPKYSTKSDMFSAGCVVYFLLTNGYHPFALKKNVSVNWYGDASASTRAVTNIIDKEYSLDILGHLPVAQHLVGSLLGCPSLLPENRCDADQAVAHPLFWTISEQLDFLQYVFNQLGKRHEEHSTVYDWFDKRCNETKIWDKICPGNTFLKTGINWNSYFEADQQFSVFMDQISNVHMYDTTSVVGLLQMIQNVRQQISRPLAPHREMCQKLRRVIGALTDVRFGQFILHRFPSLVIELYDRTFDREATTGLCVADVDGTIKAFLEARRNVTCC